MNFKEIPIIILTRDRLGCLQKQIEAFEARGYKNLKIIDNASTYSPLLEYLKSLPYEVTYLDQNYGHTAFVSKGIIQKYSHDYYAYTDPDVIPSFECPDDFMEHFYNLLQKYPQCRKAGFGLRIDDIPDHYHKKAEMVGWETQFWQTPLGSDAFWAPIDTTFALGRPGSNDLWAWSARSTSPYLAQHATWYLDPNNLPEDERYYAMNLTNGETNWSGANI